MKNLRNRNQPVNADLVQVYLQSSWDIVTAVYAALDDIQTLADQINGPGLNFLSAVDIDTLAELNAILTDATLGDAADFATAAQGAKVDFLTVTQPVDLDALEARVNDLDASVVLRGQWDASSGSFPGGGTAQAGDSWIVSVGGTMDGVSFVADDRIIAILDNASTSVFAANWHKADYSDLVSSVAGLTGAITASGLRTAINVEDGATADQTGAEIKSLYEAELDTNAFTDALLSKLNAIEAGATADQSDAEIKTAYENLTTLVSQVEAEAGVATTVRLWTAERVGQAIAALGGRFGKFDATVDPAVGDDSGDGFVVGSLWVNVTADTAWICLDNSLGAAVWIEITATGGGGGMTVTAVKTANYNAAANEVVRVDSSGGTPFTITLPSGPATESRVIVMDVGKACTLYPVTIGRNGATIDGAADDFILDQNHGRWDGAYDGVSDWAAHLTGTPEVVNVDVYVSGYSSVNAQTGTSYIPTLDDQNALVTMNNAAANTFDIPANSSVAYDVGTVLNVMQIGAGQTTVTVTTDTLNGNPKINAQYEQVSVVKIATTTWVVIGGVA